MPNQHSSNIFIMDLNRNGILEALKELLNILNCSKCNKSFCDSQQFLKCGHLSCISCLNNNRSCYLCSSSHGCNVTQDQEMLDKIVLLCEQVVVHADNIRLKKESDESKFTAQPEVKPPVELASDVAGTSVQPTQTKKRRKRRGRAKSNSGEEVKKPKVIPLKIPKNIEKTNHKGETILLVECRKNHIENVKLLLAANPKPNLNTRCAAGWTPLQECADFGYFELLSLLLEAEANPNFPGFEGRTALHEAVKSNFTDIVKLLMEYGADKDVMDLSGKRPIDYCTSSEVRELLGCSKKGNGTTSSEPCVIDNAPKRVLLEKATSDSNNVPRTTGILKLREVRRKKSTNISKDMDEKKISNGLDSAEQPRVLKKIDEGLDPPTEKTHKNSQPSSTSTRCNWSAFASERAQETSEVKNSSTTSSDSSARNHSDSSNKSHGSNKSLHFKSSQSQEENQDVNNSEEGHHLDLYYAGSDLDASQNLRESESIIISSDSDELIDVEN